MNPTEHCEQCGKEISEHEADDCLGMCRECWHEFERELDAGLIRAFVAGESVLASA